MEDKEKEFIKNVNVDKAKNKTIPAIVIIILSISTYILPLKMGEIDFGIIFEIASLVFLLISRHYMLKYDEINAKRFIVYSIASIGWILVYDFIYLFSSIADAIDAIYLPYIFYYEELLSITYISLLFAMNKNLAKAENPVKYRESTDWFYETYEEKEKENSIK